MEQRASWAPVILTSLDDVTGWAAGRVKLGVIVADTVEGKLWWCTSLDPLTFSNPGLGHVPVAHSSTHNAGGSDETSAHQLRSGSSLPGSPSLGDVFYLTTDECLYIGTTT